VSTTERTRINIFLTRGLVAIVWAVAFGAASDSVTTGVTVGAGILLVLYPLIDAVATLIDARSQQGTTRRFLLANAAAGVVAAVALGVAATGTVADVLVVFGAWAFVTGGAQLVVVLRRRSVLGNQWPLILANSFSVIAGIVYFGLAAGNNPELMPLVFYAATGGAEFVLTAWLIARRSRRRLAAVPA
jgi:uncharacterized membrane protein HdeD (DUF308 family)